PRHEPLNLLRLLLLLGGREPRVGTARAPLREHPEEVIFRLDGLAPLELRLSRLRVCLYGCVFGGLVRGSVARRFLFYFPCAVLLLRVAPPGAIVCSIVGGQRRVGRRQR